MSAAVHSDLGRGPFEVVIVSASLGGPAAVSQVLAGLPADFPAAVLVVQHRRPVIDGQLADALATRCALPVRLARDGQPATVAGVSVLPARHTGTVEDTGTLRVQPHDDFRLADPLIVGAATHFGARALSVVLTGRLDDGAAGTRALKRHGGRTVVQDPATAQAPDMPMASLATGCVDLVMPLDRISAALITLTMAPGAAALFRVPPPPWANLVA